MRCTYLWKRRAQRDSEDQELRNRTEHVVRSVRLCRNLSVIDLDLFEVIKKRREVEEEGESDGGLSVYISVFRTFVIISFHFSSFYLRLHTAPVSAAK